MRIIIKKTTHYHFKKASHNYSKKNIYNYTKQPLIIRFLIKAILVNCAHFGHSILIKASAKRVIFEFIEVFYNRIRRHAKTNNQSPANFANQYYINYPIAA